VAKPAVADHPGRGEMLIAAHFLPPFDQHSGGLRLKTLIGVLAGMGWRVTYGSLARRDRLPGVQGTEQGRQLYEDMLRNEGVERILYGPDEIDRFLAERGPRLGWAFLSFPDVAADLMPLVRCRCPTARIAFDMVDFHGLRVAREASLRGGDAALEAEAEHLRGIEIACAKAADVTIAITADEKIAMLGLVPEAVVEVLPNIFQRPDRLPASVDGRRDLFFVGGFWHKPNVDAVLWFVERIWPLIRRKAPGCRFRIAGSNPSDDVLALGANPGVEVLGFVPDLAPLFNSHRVFVAPLRYGAGMKGKVGQSLAHGLPVVTTAVGAEGMNLQNGKHVLVAEQEEEFAAEVLRLLADDALWSRLSLEGRALVERTLSVDAVRERVAAVFGG
jgi:glycosyltransferase involved in cell wall biosynthesis